MVYVLSDAQRLKKSEQNSKRYYELKEIKLKNKAIALEKKKQMELERKQKIKENRIYNFHHMALKRPKYVPQINDDILLNDLIHHDSESDDEKEPVPYEQPSRLKFTFV